MLMKLVFFINVFIGLDYVVYEIMDGGENWSIFFSVNSDEQFRIYVSQGDYLWIFSFDLLIYYFFDNGVNWMFIFYEGIFFLLYFMEFVNVDLGFMGGISGIFFKIIDGGDSWM